jgi:intein/homing endonuclease
MPGAELLEGEAEELAVMAQENLLAFYAWTGQHRTHRGKELDFQKNKFQHFFYLTDTKYLVVMKSTQCFPAGTIVMTLRGPLPIESIKAGEYVLTGKGRYRRVLATKTQETNELKGFKADNGGTVECTLDHQLWGSAFNEGKYHYKKREMLNPKWRMAREVGMGDYLAYPRVREWGKTAGIRLSNYLTDGIVEGETIRMSNQQSTVSESIVLDEGFGNLCGFYLSEGWTRLKGTEVGFGFHIKETEYTKIVFREIRRITNCDIHEAEDDHHCRRVVIRNRALHDFFKSQFGQGSGEKRIPEWAYGACKDFQRGLLQGIFWGDGCLKRKQVTLTSKSRQLLEGAKQILYSFGIPTHIIIHQGSKHEAYRIYASRKFFNGTGIIPQCDEGYTRLIDDESGILARVKMVTHRVVACKVYDLTVEEDHSYTANGYIVHNCGISEFLLGRALVSAMQGRNVFYVLPTFNLVSRFVKERLNKTMMLSPAYDFLAHGNEDGQKFSSSVSMKQVGPGTIAMVGSNTAAAFTEFAADELVIDELDRCNQANLNMAWERLSAAEESDRRQYKVSNPTITGYGIDIEYANSTQREWHLHCKHCGKYVHPDWFKHVVREVEDGEYVLRDTTWERYSKTDIQLICDCGKPLERYGAGEWIAHGREDNDHEGLRVSKIFSANVRLSEMLERFELGLVNDEAMSRFWNADLGLAFNAKGARLDEEDMDACIDSYPLGQRPEGGVTIAGIDVGAYFHLVVGHMAWGVPGVRVIDVQAVRDPQEVLEILRKYRAKVYVIDALPEMRISKMIAHKSKGGFVCLFQQGLSDTIGDHSVRVDRTSAMDNVKAGFTMEAIKLPRNIKSVPDYYEHMMAPTRVFDPDAKGGEGYYTWVEGSKPDHYFLATAYMLMAGRIATLSH